ncbi:transcriptional regulator, TetR family [Actinopolyspora xinjiangensis]|uniref:Transcriptional regulator, TetR family n=1 Tax=Actinopolyspora xinjiangensis TaxID=405564 RepID=A0A1H0PC21_9ACTN|nr:TetR family transcriptional regulator [Actinopolyspora xinjiangensis]SDP02642.1 transcriptional regulator, TetR family [Actinopolyspora xinjiangensis]
MARDAALTRKKLLEAAREEFAALGVAGARVDRIAERAEVNKERVYGHFGNKEGLFAAVVTAALDELAESVAKPTGDIGAWVGSVYEFHRDRPELLRLLMWEALHAPERELPGERERAARYSMKVDVLAERLGLPVGPETAAVLLSLIGLAAWPSAVPQLARQIVGPQVETRHVQEVIRTSIMELASRAVGEDIQRSD